MKVPRRFLFVAIPPCIVALAVLARIIILSPEGEELAQVPIPVRVAQPQKGDLVKEITLGAWVESPSMVTLVPLVSGIIKELPFDIGQAVAKDSVVARLDDERFRLQLRQAEAGYTAAKSTWERVDQLYRSGATSLQNREQAKGQFDAASSQYELARLQLDWAQVKSPVDGVVLLRHLSPGSIASPERPLITIGKLDELELRLKLSERWYPYFTPDTLERVAARLEREGDRVEDGGPRSLPLEIRAVSPVISPETRSFELVLSIPPNDQHLRPGMYVQVVLELERRSAVWSLSERCLSGDGKLWYVEEGRAKSRVYEPAFRSDERFLLDSELADRAWICEGHFFLRDGAPVAVLP